jgi:hypothetical protein
MPASNSNEDQMERESGRTSRTPFFYSPLIITTCGYLRLKGRKGASETSVNLVIKLISEPMRLDPTPQLDLRIRRYLDHCPPAISGQSGHNQTFKVACALIWGFALPRDVALRYLEIYNARCEPRWSPAELAHKIDSSLKAPCSKPVGYLRCSR